MLLPRVIFSVNADTIVDTDVTPDDVNADSRTDAVLHSDIRRVRFIDCVPTPEDHVAPHAHVVDAAVPDDGDCVEDDDDNDAPNAHVVDAAVPDDGDCVEDGDDHDAPTAHVVDTTAVPDDGAPDTPPSSPCRGSRIRCAPARLEHEQVEQAFATNCLFTYDRSSSSPCQSLPSSGYYDNDGDFADAFLELDNTADETVDSTDEDNQTDDDDHIDDDAQANFTAEERPDDSSSSLRRPPTRSSTSAALQGFHTSMLRCHDPIYYASRISCPSLSRRHFRALDNAHNDDDDDGLQANVAEELRDILSDHMHTAAPCPITTADILKSISKDLLHTLGLPIPGTMSEALAHPTARPFWREAIHKEFRGCIPRGTWRLEPLPRGRRRIRCKWIFDLKPGKFKARLVAMGFSQRFGEDYSATFSPVANSDSVRSLIAVAAHRTLAFHHIDVSFEELFVQQPEGFVQFFWPHISPGKPIDLTFGQPKHLTQFPD